MISFMTFFYAYIGYQINGMPPDLHNLQTKVPKPPLTYTLVNQVTLQMLYHNVVSQGHIILDK